MNDYMKKIVEEGYDKGSYAQSFRTNKNPNEMEKAFLDKLVTLVPKQSNILDLGCGVGLPFDSYLVEAGFNVTGIDISTNHLEQAKKNVPEATFIKGDFSEYDFRNTFNAIISFYAIFHIPRDEHAMLFNKMYDLLEPGGVILVTLGTRDSEREEESKWFGSPKMAWSTYSPQEYEKIVRDVGFAILETSFEGLPDDEEHHFWLMAQKT